MAEEYEEIDLLELMRNVIKRWWLILLFAVIAGGLSYFITQNYISPVYEAKSVLFIGKESGSSITDFSLSDLERDSTLVVDYQELIKTRLVTSEVVENMGLDVDPEVIADNLSVEVINDSRFINVTFDNTDPALAAEIVNELSETLVEKAEDIIGIENVQVVDSALVPDEPISPSLKKNLVIAVLFGVVVALGVIFVLYMMDNTVKSEEELENKLGLPVLGIIPKHGEVRP